MFTIQEPVFLEIDSAKQTRYLHPPDEASPRASHRQAVKRILRRRDPFEGVRRCFPKGVVLACYNCASEYVYRRGPIEHDDKCTDGFGDFGGDGRFAASEPGSSGELGHEGCVRSRSVLWSRCTW
ncbi:hypothetical protein GUJ93_ZPchr0009g2365 [Zizania palustris]|uniref:Uncharacterized protein n=1 Tax=Zizania palustris TaxID=103762 RepID=A0A8J5RKB5_ZIZPA|nr:hypothetical protein GUJ93_ZPchr0009g2365 [Zizania palustris]